MANQNTSQLVPLTEARDGILILKNGSMRAVLEVTAINFELRSSDEQAGIVQNFQSFLNAIDFPIQIVINSRVLNLDTYLKLVAEAKEQVKNELLRVQAVEYEKFIKEIATLANIMSKKFYICVPLYGSESQESGGFFSSITSLFNKAGSNKRVSDEEFQKQKIQILQRAELVLDGLISLGLKARLLESDELINIFYELYNPGENSLPTKKEGEI